MSGRTGDTGTPLRRCPVGMGPTHNRYRSTDHPRYLSVTETVRSRGDGTGPGRHGPPEVVCQRPDRLPRRSRVSFHADAAAGVPVGDRPARLPAVDGLRALAVTAVLLYHLPVAWLPGGFLGVDVFFVISGFLITSLITAEVRRSGRIDLRNFWMRRAAVSCRRCCSWWWSSWPRRRSSPAMPVPAGLDLPPCSLLHQLVADLPPRQLLPVGGRPLWSCICGPWPWKSSSIFCGR